MHYAVGFQRSSFSVSLRWHASRPKNKWNILPFECPWDVHQQLLYDILQSTIFLMMNVQRIRTSALEIFIGRNKQKTFDTELAELKLNEKGSLNYLGTTNQIPFTSFNVHFFWAGWKESDRETDICMAGNYHQLVYCMKWGRQLLWRHKEWLQCRRLSSPRRKDEYPVISSSFWREIITTVRLSTPCIITNDTHKAT